MAIKFPSTISLKIFLKKVILLKKITSCLKQYMCCEVNEKCVENCDYKYMQKKNKKKKNLKSDLITWQSGGLMPLYLILFMR